MSSQERGILTPHSTGILSIRLSSVSTSLPVFPLCFYLAVRLSSLFLSLCPSVCEYVFLKLKQKFFIFVLCCALCKVQCSSFSLKMIYPHVCNKIICLTKCITSNHVSPYMYVFTLLYLHIKHLHDKYGITIRKNFLSTYLKNIKCTE